MMHDPHNPPYADPSPCLVYRLCAEAEWRLAVAEGLFAGADADRRDGFIHLSSADQVAETADTHYATVRPLILLTVDARRVNGEIRWEESRGGALFPHLYGTIPVEAVLAAQRLADDRQGRAMIPPLKTAPGDLEP